MGQVGVYGPCAVGGEQCHLVHVPGFAAFQNHGYPGAHPDTDQVLFKAGDCQQGWDGQVTFVHTTVGENQDVHPVPAGPGALRKEGIQGLPQRSLLFIEQGHGAHRKGGMAEVPDPEKVFLGDHRGGELQYRTVVFPHIQQVSVIPDIDGTVCLDFLPQGVYGRVGDLGKALPEIV